MAIMAVRAAQADDRRASPYGASAECHGPRWIAVEFGPPWTREQRRALIQHLEVGFDVHDVAVCEASRGQGQPSATLHVGSDDADVVALRVTFHDESGAERVERQVAVSGYSKEARALAVAVAAEELVRARWADLGAPDEPAVAPASEPVAKRAAPREAVSTPQAERTREPRSTFVGARAAAEIYAGGQRHLGFDVVLRRELFEPLSVVAALGARWAAEEEHDLGVARARALAGELSLAGSLMDGEVATLALEAGLRGGRLAFEGESDQADEERSWSGPFLVTRGGLRLGLWLSERWLVELGAGVGATLVGAEALARGSVVSGVSGAELHGTFGMGGTL